MAPTRLAAGISLIETMITVAIIGILLVLAIPMVGDWLKNAQIRTAAESLQNALVAARTEAVRCNVPVKFMLGAGNDSSWRIEFAYPVLPTPCTNSVPAAQWPLIQARSAVEGSINVVVDPTPVNTTTVTFDGFGRRMTSNADGSGVLTRMCIDLPAIILPADRTRDLQINIETGGGVRMCDPKVTDQNDTRYCPDRANSSCTGR